MSDFGRIYDAPEYVAPNILKLTGSFLRAPRGKYSTNFTDVFSSDREVQHQYVNGLLAVILALLIVFIFWVFVLFVLKFRGEEMGCASGRAFTTQHEEEEQSTDDDDGSQFSSLRSDSLVGSQEDSVAKLIKQNQSNFTEQSEQSIRSLQRSLGEDPTTNTKKIQAINKRERRTRFCFLFFGLLSLACVLLILIFSFGPLKEASDSSDEVIKATRDVLIQVNTTISSIKGAMSSAHEIVSGLELDIESICPNVESEGMEERIGIDLNELIGSLGRDFKSMQGVSDENIGFIRGILERFESGLSSYEESLDTVENWMWMIPAILFAVCILTATAMFGVLLAWRGESSKRTQSLMSYVLLPLLATAAVACWTMVLVMSLGTMIGSDVCTASNSRGTPDQTIQHILGVLEINQNSSAFVITNAYTNHCTGESPTKDIEEVEREVQIIIDILWRQISRVDSIGRSQIAELCGGTNFDSLLLASRNLAQLLTSIRRSLDSTSRSMSCPRINPLYIEIAHEIVCTDVATAVACGFIVFFTLGISLMVMLSLRASWLQNILEEKVYHDEIDVAENMILDEHEEYLAYISKYKHEWEEYRGFDENEIVSPFGEDEAGWETGSEVSTYVEDDEEDQTEVEGSDGSQNGCNSSLCDTEATPPGFQVTIVETGSTHNPSIASMDGVSVPNFDAEGSLASTSDDEIVFDYPQPPPARNPGYRLDPDGHGARPKLTRRQSSNKPVSSAPRRTKEDRSAMLPSESFFEKYGIRPGASARPRCTIPLSPTTVGRRDPPASLGTRGKLPSGRSFFNATAACSNASTNEEGVEIHLVSPPHISTAKSKDTFEC